MKKSHHLSQSGSTTLTVLLVIMVFVIGALIYILLTQSGPQHPRHSNIDLETEQTAPATPRQSERAGNYAFDDGLKNPDSSTRYTLDEMGTGLASTDIFNLDINADGHKDRISRSLYENGNDHFYYDYKIELNLNGDYVNITPEYFRTTEGAECALQKLRFTFRPNFQVIKISRPWEESWITPSIATKTTYKFLNNNLNEISTIPLKEICNVSDLF